MLWHDATTPVLVYAYAPYQANANLENLNFSVNTDQSTNGSLSSDFVRYVCSNTEEAPSSILSNGAIPVQFSHCLEQCIVNLSFADELGTQTPTVSSVQMLNVKTSCSYNVITGSCASSSLSNPQNVVMYPDVASSKYSVIVPTQDFEPNVRLFKITLSDGREFLYVPSAKVSLPTPGSCYTFNLRIGKDKVSLSSDITVTEWNENAGIFISSGDASELIDVTNHKIVSLQAGSITAADVQKVAPSGTRVLYIEGPINAADLKTIADNTNSLLVNLFDAKLDNSDGKFTNLDLTGHSTLFYTIDASYATSALALSWKLDDNNSQLQYLGKKITLTLNYPYPNSTIKATKDFFVGIFGIYLQELPYSVLFRTDDTAIAFDKVSANKLEHENLVGFNTDFDDMIKYNLKNKKISLPDGLYWYDDGSQMEWKSTYTTPVHIEKANVTTTTAKAIYHTNFHLYN